MLSEEEILALREYAGRMIDPVNRYLIRDAADRIAHAGEISATTEYLTYRAETLGRHFDDIVKELAKRLQVSEEKIREMYNLAAMTDYDNQLRRVGRGHVPYEQNGGVQQTVRAATELALDEFGRLTNITRSLGMTGPKGEALPLRRFYRNAMDYVYNNVSTGAMSLDTALRFACERLAGRGLLYIDYESGTTTSLEAAVRRNLMGGLGLMCENIAQHNHDTLGCNGWEMSAHAMSAPDHEPYQGRQYSDAEWIELNGLPPRAGAPANQPEKQGILKRRVGTLNCGHTASPIILGVNLPQYSKEELAAMAEKNAEGVEVGGKRYTLYKASQKMRQCEKDIRYWKRQFDAAEGAQNEPLMEKAASRLHRAQQRYAEFSGESGLRPQSGRTYVTGHGRSAAGKAKWVNRSVETRKSEVSGKLTESGNRGIINTQGGAKMEIDKFTPCLERRETGETIQTSYSPASERELKSLKGWNFNWTDSSLKDAQIYKLTARGDKQIQGLVAINAVPKDMAVYVHLVESAPHNLGKNKLYNGVGGHLFAIAMQKSKEAGFGGFIFLDAKNRELVGHYEKTLGAVFIGRPHPYRMLVDEENAEKILKIYTLEGE